jgi:hypothetical protein
LVMIFFSPLTIKEHPMKNLVVFIISFVFLSACSTSNSLTYSRRAENYQPKKYNNIGVVAILKSNEGRIRVEDGVAAALRAKGFKVTETWSIWPLANNTALMKEHGVEGEKLRDMIRQRVATSKMDALIIVTLFNARKETRYVPGSSSSVGIGVGVNTGMYPMYGYPYYAYVGYAVTTTSEPGYYEDASTYFTESNLYDMTTENLVWTGQVTTKMESSLENEADKFGKVLVDGMIAAGVLVK